MVRAGKTLLLQFKRGKHVWACPRSERWTVIEPWSADDSYDTRAAVSFNLNLGILDYNKLDCAVR